MTRGYGRLISFDRAASLTWLPRTKTPFLAVSGPVVTACAHEVHCPSDPDLLPVTRPTSTLALNSSAGVTECYFGALSLCFSVLVCRRPSAKPPKGGRGCLMSASVSGISGLCFDSISLFSPLDFFLDLLLYPFFFFFFFSFLSDACSYIYIYLRYVFRVLINSLVCWFCTSALGFVLFQIFANLMWQYKTFANFRAKPIFQSGKTTVERWKRFFLFFLSGCSNQHKRELILAVEIRNTSTTHHNDALSETLKSVCISNQVLVYSI